MKLEHPGLAQRLGTQRSSSPAEAEQWFERSVGWVRGFAAELASWRGLLRIIETTQRQVRSDGLHLASGQALEPLLTPADDQGRRFAARVCEFLRDQGARVPPGRRYVGCSDVIESVFGKYKSYLERSPTRSLGANVVLFPLFVTRINVEWVAQALEAVKHRTAQEFVRLLGGPSQRHQVLGLRPPP
jgi:hypothetical protein